MQNKASGQSPNTVRWYSYHLEPFERFLGAGPGLTVENVRHYVADRQDHEQRQVNNPQVLTKAGKLSSSYIQGAVRALRAFSSWLHEEGYSETNVLKPLRPPRIQQKVVPVLSDEEVMRIVSSLNTNEPFAARDLAIIWTLLEVLSLDSKATRLGAWLDRIALLPLAWTIGLWTKVPAKRSDSNYPSIRQPLVS